MDEQQYRAVCDVCDSILDAPDSSYDRVSIPWLHVVREHPVFLRQYNGLFGERSSLSISFQYVKRLFVLNAIWLYRLIKQANMRRWWKRRSHQTYHDSVHAAEVIFVSHLVNSSHLGSEIDFYFGDVPVNLHRQGIKCEIVLLDHRDAHSSGRVDCAGVPRRVLPKFLTLREECALHGRLWMESLRLLRLASKEAPGLRRRALVVAAQEALSEGAHTALRVSKQVGALVEGQQPKAIVVVHEGHAWERLTFAAARAAAPRLICVGYQHAALFRLQHAIRRDVGLDPRYNPDWILAAGLFPESELKRAPRLAGKRVSILGSQRAAQRQPERPAEGRSGAGERACLVLPEGIWEECEFMFNFSLNSAALLPDIKFTWRLHPLLSYESLAARNPRLRVLPPNVTISNGSLEQDAAKCAWTLYRGTTAVVQAVESGSRPIYLARPGEMSIDPLFDMKQWRLTVMSPEELVATIRADENMDEASLGAAEASDLCRRLFSPLDAQALRDALATPRGP